MIKTLLFSIILQIGSTCKMNAQNSSFEYDIPQIALLIDKASFIGEFSEGFLNLYIDGNWGYINSKGEIIAPFEYIQASPFSCGMAKVVKNHPTRYISGFVNVKGQFVTNEYLMGAEEFHDGLAITFNGYYGVVDKQGRLVVPYQPNRIIEDYKDGMAIVRINYKFGAYNTNGQLVVPIIYDGMRSFSSGLAVAQIESKQFYVRKNGTRLQPPSLISVEDFRDNVAKVKTINGRGFMDSNGRFTELPYPLCCDMEFFSEGLAVVQNCLLEPEPKKGYMNKYGRVVIPTEYDEAYAFSNGMAKVAKNGHYGFVNANGMLVVNCIYDDVIDFCDGFGIVKQNNKYGYINKQGKLLGNIEYDEAQPFSYGIAKVKRNGKIGFVDKNGRCTLDYIVPDSEEKRSEGTGIIKIFGD